MKHFCIISGGMIEDSFASSVIAEEKPDVIIAADSGMEFLYRNQIKPQVIVGDFDSVKKEILEFYKKQPQIQFVELNPMKDDTDTESAVRLAISMGAEKITLLGATGSRLDHVLGNIELLGIGLMADVPIEMLDAHNRVCMIQHGITKKRENLFGRYISLIPYTKEVEHLTLKGFKYPLTDACLKGFCSLGISNEIVEEEAEITFERGILLVIESKDE